MYFNFYVCLKSENHDFLLLDMAYFCQNPDFSQKFKCLSFLCIWRYRVEIWYCNLYLSIFLENNQRLCKFAQKAWIWRGGRSAPPGRRVRKKRAGRNRVNKIIFHFLKHNSIWLESIWRLNLVKPPHCTPPRGNLD